MGWEMIMTGQSPVYVDYILTLIFTIAALTQYTAIAVSGAGPMGWKALVGFGWTLWAVRFWWAWAFGDDPIVPPVAAVAITMIGVGAIMRNVSESVCDRMRGHLSK